MCLLYTLCRSGLRGCGTTRTVCRPSTTDPTTPLQVHAIGNRAPSTYGASAEPPLQCSRHTKSRSSDAASARVQTCACQRIRQLPVPGVHAAGAAGQALRCVTLAPLCAGIVLFWLLRQEPFTGLARELQGGHFDHADRCSASPAVHAGDWSRAAAFNVAELPFRAAGACLGSEVSAEWEVRWRCTPMCSSHNTRQVCLTALGQHLFAWPASISAFTALSFP